MVKKERQEVIPAASGWMVVSPSADYDGLSKEDIIGWYITLTDVRIGDKAPYVWPDPITLDGIPPDDGEWAIESPRGGFFIPYGAGFESEIELLKHFKDEAARTA